MNCNPLVAVLDPIWRAAHGLQTGILCVREQLVHETRETALHIGQLKYRFQILRQARRTIHVDGLRQSAAIHTDVRQKGWQSVDVLAEHECDEELGESGGFLS